MQVKPPSITSPARNKQRSGSRKPSWRIVLGRTAWSKYTYERLERDDLKLLGSVSKGSQVGALAMTPEGKYVQVVGDHMVPLNGKEIAKAVAHAPKEANSEDAKETRTCLVTDKEPQSPLVIVKKRRVAVMP